MMPRPAQNASQFYITASPAPAQTSASHARKITISRVTNVKIAISLSHTASPARAIMPVVSARKSMSSQTINSANSVRMPCPNASAARLSITVISARRVIMSRGITLHVFNVRLPSITARSASQTMSAPNATMTLDSWMTLQNAKNVAG